MRPRRARRIPTADATVAMAAPAPAPAPAAAAPAQDTARASDADEVSRTLTSLADLRERGVISAEEYEAKKAELLGRL